MQAQIQQQLPPETREYIRLTHPDMFPEYAARYLKIMTKDDGVQPFVLNTPQTRLHAEIERLRKERLAQGRVEGIRLIILKARQEGFSTYTKGREYNKVTTQEGFSTATITHKDQSTQHLYNMFKRFYDNFPKDLKPHRKSPGNQKHMIFDQLDSSLHVFTAGSSMSTSGFTFQFVHVSELSKWEGDVNATWTSLMQTLAMTADIVIESTANGVGNLFHEMWVKAESGENDYTPMFFPWFEQVEYRIPERHGEVFIPDEEERYYIDKHGLDLDQVRWMRDTRVNKCMGDWSVFRQEYPANPEEAFMESGNPVFSVPKLRKREIELKNIPVHRGEFVAEDKIINGKPKLNVTFERSDKGSVHIYHYPQDAKKEVLWSYRYSIGADVCEGIDRTGKQRGRSQETDYNTASMMDRVFHEEGKLIGARQVTFIRNKFETHDFAKQLLYLMIYFGGNVKPHEWGMAVIERNNPGLSVLMFMKELMKKFQYPIGRLYHRADMDVDYETPSEYLGWRTMADTKEVMIGETIRRLNDGTDGIRSIHTINEHMYYVRDLRGKANAQIGKHDDAVISQGLAYQGMKFDLPPMQCKPEAPPLPMWMKTVFGKSGRGKIGYWT